MSTHPLRATRVPGRFALAMLGILAVLLGAGAAVQAATAKPDFAIGSQPTSQSIRQGQSATYTLTVSGSNGFAGTVTLSSAGRPAGVTATFSPASVPLTGSTTRATSTLTVAAASSAAVGSYTFTVNGASGSTKRSLSLGLTVTKALPGSFTIAAAPATVSVAPGASAVYAVTVSRDHMTRPVTLGLRAGLPSGVSGSFTPDPVTGTSSTLQIATSSSTRDGTYTLYLVGSVDGTYQYAQTTLVVDSKLKSKAFGISGGPTGKLAPGAAPRPIDLKLTNPNNQAMSVTNLTVTVKGTNRAGCTAADFAVMQYSGPYPLSLPKNAAGTPLSALGAATAALPTLRMLDLPRNQDACKGAAVSLSYSGSGQGN